uniref:SGNH domain-containing protein n=1 Tax=Panagrolaimus sp. JU765 TaxID=591449 RepID=A0AC34QDP7_9BILA
MTVMLIGNSYAEKISQGIVKIMDGKFKTIHLVYKPYCSVFPGLSGDGKGGCDIFENLTVESVKLVQPDILFISSKFHIFPAIQEPITNDTANFDNATFLIQSALDIYSNFTDHIIIIEPQAVFNHPIAYHLAKSLAGYEDIHQLDYSIE